jgi:hypothetical protein
LSLHSLGEFSQPLKEAMSNIGKFVQVSLEKRKAPEASSSEALKGIYRPVVPTGELVNLSFRLTG